MIDTVWVAGIPPPCVYVKFRTPGVAVSVVWASDEPTNIRTTKYPNAALQLRLERRILISIDHDSVYLPLVHPRISKVFKLLEVLSNSGQAKIADGMARAFFEHATKRSVSVQELDAAMALARQIALQNLFRPRNPFVRERPPMCLPFHQGKFVES